MTNKEKLVSYIRTLTPEQAADAKNFIYSWLSERQATEPHPLRKECAQAQ